MSDAEKRQSRQRALTVGACAAVFAFGGPLIAQRFQGQKQDEAFRANAVVLAGEISVQSRNPAQLVSFTNKADEQSLLHKASYKSAYSAPEADAYTADDSSEDMLGGLTLRAKDIASMRGLVTFDFDAISTEHSLKAELQCLSEAIYYEARSEDELGQLAVAEVVINRVNDSRFPNTVCGVVYQGQYRDTGCQFTFTCDGSLHDKPRGPAWDRAKAIALHVSLGLAKPVTNKATHYHTDYVNPYWKAGMVETAVHGTHIFYRFPKGSREWSTARNALAAQEARENEGFIEVDMNGGAPDEAPVGAGMITVAVTPGDIPAAVPAIAPATQVADSRPL